MLIQNKCPYQERPRGVKNIIDHGSLFGLVCLCGSGRRGQRFGFIVSIRIDTIWSNSPRNFGYLHLEG